MSIPWRLYGRSRARSLQALVLDLILRIQIFSEATLHAGAIDQVQDE